MSPVRRPRVARATLAVVATLLIALRGAGCSGSADSEPEQTAAPSEAVDEGTPLADVDTTSLVVARAPFCDAVDPAAVARALGEEPAEGSAYRSGQRIKLSDDVADVVHEFGCRWTAGDGVAEAWVFVPPVTRERADDLVRTGCRGVQDPVWREPAISTSVAPTTPECSRTPGSGSDSHVRFRAKIAFPLNAYRLLRDSRLIHGTV